MQDPRQYFSTHAVNLFYALHVALQRIAAEGLSERFTRHRETALRIRAGLAESGFKPLTRERYLADTLSVLAYPRGMDDMTFRDALAARGVIAAGCLGTWRGRGIRFGHMGNIEPEEVERGLRVITEVSAQSAVA